jgi:hypothetical protein
VKLHIALGALGASLAQGCFYDCEPEPDVSVTLEQPVEDVRSLPILSSGKTRLLSVNLPDAHGDDRVRLKMVNASSVVVDGLSFTQTIDGVVRNIELVAQQHNDQDVSTGGTVVEGGVLRFAWRMKNLAEYVLPVGKSHLGKATLNWRFEGCRAQTGVASLDISGLVKAAASASHFALADSPAPEAYKADTLLGAKARVAVKSAVGESLINIGQAKMTITYFGDGLVPALGLGLLSSPDLTLQSGGLARTSIGPTEVLEAYSSNNPSANAASYDFDGQAATTGTLSTGKALITLELSSAKASQPTVQQIDSLSALVDWK